MVLDTIDLTEDTDEDPDEDTDKDTPIKNTKDDGYEDDDGIVWYGWNPPAQQKELDDDNNESIENGSDNGDFNMDVLSAELEKIEDNEDIDFDVLLEELAKN